MKAAINLTKINLSAIVALLLLLLPASVSAAEDWEYNKTRYPNFSGGSGTKDDPYLISTAQDLASLTYMSSFNFRDYTYYEGIYFKQTADIVLNDNVVSSVVSDSYGRVTFDESVLANFKDWIPIGTFGQNNNCYWFRGHYDGGGHSISGIYCYRGDTHNTLGNGNGYDNYLGLFGAVQSGSITNLTVKDCLIRVHDVSSWTKEWRYIGSIVGRADDELISNCHVENSIICFDDGNNPSEISVGGVVGYCNITGSYSSNYELKNCSFEGKLNVYNDNSYCAPSIGGICGSIVAADEYLNSHHNPVVSNCLARGVIAYNYNNTTNAGETGVETGGILGKFANGGSTKSAYASINRCTNFVNTDVVANSGNVYAGGLSGYMARCEQSANFGNVTINGYGGTVANVYAGGIGSFVSIDNCANYGTVTLGAEATNHTTTVKGDAYLGALAVCGIGSDAAKNNPCHILNSVSCADVVFANVTVTGNYETDAVSVFSNATNIKENVYYYSHNNTGTSYACRVPWDGKPDFMKYDNVSILNNNANGNIWGQLDAPSSTFYKYIMPLTESSVPSVKLDEKADDIISVIADNNYDAAEDNKVSVTLVRGLKQGYWNTVCLPFAVTADNLKAAFGNDVKLETLKDVTVDDNGVLTLNFEAAAAMEAGKPYIINPSKVSTDNTYVLGTYALSASLHEATGSSNGNDVSMIGSFDKFTLDGKSEVVDQYFLQGDKFYHIVPEKPISANGFRCYFTVSSNTAQQALTLAKIQHANGSTTAIKIVKVGNTADGSAIYDLQGIKHDSMSKGVYIKNGKKFVVR